MFLPEIFEKLNAIDSYYVSALIAMYLWQTFYNFVC